MKKIGIRKVVAFAVSASLTAFASAQPTPKYPDYRGYMLGITVEQMISKVAKEFPSFTWMSPSSETRGDTPIWNEHLPLPSSFSGADFPITFASDFNGKVIRFTFKQSINSSLSLEDSIKDALKKYGNPYYVYKSDSFLGKETYQVGWAADVSGVLYADKDTKDDSCNNSTGNMKSWARNANCAWTLYINATRDPKKPDVVQIETTFDSPASKLKAGQRALGNNGKASF